MDYKRVLQSSVLVIWVFIDQFTVIRSLRALQRAKLSAIRVTI